MAHEAPCGVNGGDHGVPAIAHAAEGATGGKGGGVMREFECARGRGERERESRWRRSSAARRWRRRARLREEEVAGEKKARGRRIFIRRSGEMGGVEACGPFDFDRTVHKGWAVRTVRKSNKILAVGFRSNG